MEYLKTVILDLEANALENPTKIWCIVCREINVKGETEKVNVFTDFPGYTPLADFNGYSNGVDTWIGHNIILYDCWVLYQLLHVQINYQKCIDTLVLSRLLDFTRQGGHSLQALSGGLKTEFNHWKDFDKYFKEGIEYCVNDTYINLLVYLKFINYINSSKWKPSISLEHFIQYLTLKMHLNGFKFNQEKAKELYTFVLSLRHTIDKELLELFPKRVIPIKTVTPVATKFGTINQKDFRFLKDSSDLSSYSVGDSFTVIKYEEPNLSSNKQMIDVLHQAGWRPIDKTEGYKKALTEKDTPKEKLEYYEKYGWKINEENLQTLPESAPTSAKKLAERIMLSSRIGDLEEWLSCYNPDTGRIHGSFQGIGAWTHRMAHQRPNTANIVGVKTRGGEVAFLGKELRQLWTCDKGNYLIGTDAKGIQLRILAHYMNDPEFIYSVCSGTKENGDDPHSLNAAALGPICKSREPAKTFIYAWLLGAGIVKISSILSCSRTEAKAAVERFIIRYPGLRRLKKDVIPRDAQKGYFEGLDGRLVRCNSEHLMLAGYLQNAEKVIMSLATQIWTERLEKEKLSSRYFLVDFVHDEWQTECKGSRDLAEYIGQVQSQSLQEAGKRLNLNCPMDGEYTIGLDWSETH